MPGPLDGVTVVDLSRVMAAPFTTQMLSDFGATVWKIEALRGDHTREWGAHYFDAANRGKLSLGINLKDHRGQSIVRSLAARADVFVENFKVGDLRRFGLDYKSLQPSNEGLIYLSVTGFGQTGPRKDQPGYDTVAQAVTGVMTVTGEPDRAPSKVGIAWIDVMTGLAGTVGVMAALYERASSGVGQYIDLSLFDVGMMALIDAGQDYLDRGNVQIRTGSVHRNFAPAEPFRASDGWLIIAIGNDEQFRRLCDAMQLQGLLTDPRFEHNAIRLVHRAELAQILAERFASDTRARWAERFERHKLAMSPIHDIADAVGDPQTAARNIVWNIDRGGGTASVLANALQHMSRTPPAPAGPPPRLAEHTHEVLGRVLSLSEREIMALANDGVISVGGGEPETSGTVASDGGRSAEPSGSDVPSGT